ncbi:MAG TPA: GNAT family N-acetyltransferase [Chitinophagaceae bacterium]|nr:GNAT family N-acetyltransferase [Chitinophagaceae bacterium]
MACFPDSFSTRLGFNFTKRSLEWFLIAENRFLFHIESENQVIGYCGGFKSSFIGDGSTSGMLQYGMREAIQGLIRKPYLLFNPHLLKRYPLIFRNIYKRVFNSKENIPTNINYDNSKIGLVVIGVHPDYRGKGIFELLMQNFQEECKKRNVTKMTLSVKASNARAIAAYKKAGWQIASQTKKDMDMYKILRAE